MKKTIYILLFALFPILLHSAEDNALPTNGYVGVREDSPNYPLEVNGNANFSAGDELGNTLPYVEGDRTYRYTFETSGYNFLTRSSNNHHYWSVDRTDLDANGVHESVNAGNYIWLLRASASGPNGTNPYETPIAIRVDGTPTNDIINQNLQFYGDALVVKSSTGRVGIGTTNPSGVLHVKNNIDGVTNMVGKFESLNTGGSVYLKLQNLDYTGGTDHVMFADANGSIGFYQAGVSNSFVLTQDKNVGIGIDSPSNKLEVNGTIRSKEIIVETNWSDFVFEDDYTLRSLEEVSDYIDANGHLPDVPSAEVVESMGLSLGESQKIMMQKIEELTLYTLQQQQLIEQLLAANVAQQSQIETLLDSNEID